MLWCILGGRGLGGLVSPRLVSWARNLGSSSRKKETGGPLHLAAKLFREEPTGAGTLGTPCRREEFPNYLFAKVVRNQKSRNKMKNETFENKLAAHHASGAPAKVGNTKIPGGAGFGRSQLNYQLAEKQMTKKIGLMNLIEVLATYTTGNGKSLS